MSAVLAQIAAAEIEPPIEPTIEPPPFERDVLDGLAQRPKRIPCTWLYDHRGSELFERITTLPEYYPTRSEVAVLDGCAAQVARIAGAAPVVIELGSGSSRKTPRLLAALDRPALYVPIDISETFLAESVRPLAARFPSLRIEPRAADFTALDSLPLPAHAGRPLVFFPGSTVGNFTPEAATALLAHIGMLVGPGALLLIGADHTRDPEVLIPAYDDAAGVTAAFNRNLLLRINRELGANFEPGAFRHAARFEPFEPRIEMHLVSEYTQEVSVRGRRFRFARGESIHTENAYKYSPFQFLALAHRAGWSQRQLWMHQTSSFALHLFERRSEIVMPV